MLKIKSDARQKMMSVMYLVLIAFLSLQVNDTHIENFEITNTILEEQVKKVVGISIEKFLEIKTLADSIKTDKAKERYKLAENLRFKTQTLLDEMSLIKRELIQEIGQGYDPQSRTIQVKRAITEVESFMIGEGRGAQLEKNLDDYVEHLNNEYESFLGSDLLKITEMWIHSNIHKDYILPNNPDFVERYFENTSVVGAVVTISLFQSEIVRYEQEILKKLGPRGDRTDVMCCFGSGHYMLTPLNEYGKTLSSEGFKMDFVPIRLENIDAENWSIKNKGFQFSYQDYDFAKLSYQVPQDVNQPQIIKWEVTAKDLDDCLGNPNIHRQVVTTSGEFYVIPASFNWQKGAEIPLYEKCINPIQVTSILLLKHPNIHFEVSKGAALIESAENGKFMLIPDGTQQTVTIKMIKQENILDSIQFKIQEVPLPSLILTDVQGNELDISKPIALQSEVYVKVIPDEAFQMSLPDEANYQVNEIEVIQIRDAEVVDSQKFNSGKIRIQKFQVEVGNVFQLIVKDIVRLSTQFGIIPIKLKQDKIGFILKDPMKP